MTFRERHIAKSLFLLTLAHLSHPTDHKNLQDFVSTPTPWPGSLEPDDRSGERTVGAPMGAPTENR
jgi:hypothetical protein